MNPLSPRAARELGRRLHAEGFRPLPDVADGGALVGTRLWRVRSGYVEYLALRASGFAQAARVEASFDYQRPAQHGPVVEHRRGHAINALNWLITATSSDFAPYASADDLGNRAWPTG
ncbi:hypothetical protein FNH05_01880 [Amycolatopsis rhizosphaerae]|uniref:Uncharacterized protein n=1 Tax=Amycolatopsis rhizosphaerae TaxID=2053003 RepID=A0A558DLJ1_9PSEU|nr:hypothetical protein [Amycolatopsis rhizosphaerae]TVT61895.1 hypothetical protein FNH05_01880 [Amycolatopsis rhizosphaerae]